MFRLGEKHVVAAREELRRLRRCSGYLTENFFEVIGVTYGAVTFPLPFDAECVGNRRENIRLRPSLWLTQNS